MLHFGACTKRFLLITYFEYKHILQMKVPKLNGMFKDVRGFSAAELWKK